MTFSDTTYAQRVNNPSWIKFVELLCGEDSTHNQVKNFEERQSICAAKSEIKDWQKLWDDESFQTLVHDYLSYYQYNNKYQNLFTAQVMLWNTQKLGLKPYDGTDDEQLIKAVKLRDDVQDLSDKLEAKVARLFSEIYGDEKIQGIAKRKILKARTAEERLMETKAN